MRALPPEATDEMQVGLSYGTAIHRDNLVELQESHPALYVALWRRDMEAAKALVRRSGSALPPSNPKSRIRSRALRLLYGTSLLNEFERLLEVIDAVKADGGVTRQSLDAALRSSAAMPGLHRSAMPPTSSSLAQSRMCVASIPR